MTDLPCLTAFDWVPEFARGLVRDLRIRWAFEEIGRPYDTKLLGAMNPRPDDYLDWQPFDQVPAFADEGLKFFETGAILLYLGEQDERLLPTDGQDRWTAISWLFAGLNSVEPQIGRLVTYDIFHADKDWLAEQFSIADIMMVTVLNNLRHTEMVAKYPALAAYHQRGIDRPAYKRALEAQLGDFADAPPQMEQA